MVGVTGTVSIIVLMPTRDRPQNMRRVIESFDATKVRQDTFIQPVLDHNSPVYDDYILGGELPLITYVTCGSMIRRTNECAVTDAPHHSIIGWVADDNLFRTVGWDQEVVDEFEADPGLGMLNTNDLLVGDDKAGAFFLRSECVQGLGYVFPPVLEHLYADYAVNELYKAAGAHRYNENIVIEHMHPYAGKAQWDDAYRRYNTSEQDARDSNAFFEWQAISMRNDVEKIKTCLSY